LSGAFKLLDAVADMNEMVAAPLPATDTRDPYPIERWLSLAEPNLLSNAELLNSKDRLLIAFPLLVKDQFMGTLLVEEQDFPRLENPVSHSAINASRAKRIEIITGITQQISLAIQNEQMERETIEREKLDREMQLAREIQQTFLPQTLPELAGWDLEIRWRTARQVGGDFYDIFELPEERLGFVVADVADKGMPAALWMTMIRTLLHATLREMDSPPEVLAYLNHILVPDARSGMFVTMVYGVLNINSGEFFYANAGHNPPILLSARSKQVHRLETGGVVLGVMDEIVLPGRRIVLSPSDALILYTDGITEAFSPDSEIFGEERLQVVLEEALAVNSKSWDKVSLQTLLDTIDLALLDFTGGAPPSDDQTLVAFRRK
jgi:serine phosphatase RsbU (regulator of sigma subunit)